MQAAVGIYGMWLCLAHAALVWIGRSSASVTNIWVLDHKSIKLFFFFPTEMLWCGNDQNMVWFQKRYTNFLALGIKILLSGNTFCVKWWICSSDLCKWLSGGFVTHPILAVKYSFLVTYDLLDGFSWLANVLCNCQNFPVVFLGNTEKEKSGLPHTFSAHYFFFFSSLSFTLSSSLLETSQLALVNSFSDFCFLCLLFSKQLCYSWLGLRNTSV